MHETSDNEEHIIQLHYLIPEIDTWVFLDYTGNGWSTHDDEKMCFESFDEAMKVAKELKGQYPDMIISIWSIKSQSGYTTLNKAGLKLCSSKSKE